MGTGKVEYVRPAERTKDGQDGILCRENFNGSWKERVFSTHEAARLFAKRMHGRYVGP